jgi:hypothetical protein
MVGILRKRWQRKWRNKYIRDLERRQRTYIGLSEGSIPPKKPEDLRYESKNIKYGESQT